MNQVGKDVKEAAKVTFRIIAAVLGIIGSIVALITNVLYSTGSKLTGGASHGWYGLLIVVVAFIGAIVAAFSPVVGAVLMVIAAIAFFFVVKGFAIVASLILLVAALIAFLDRSKVRS